MATGDARPTARSRAPGRCSDCFRERARQGRRVVRRDLVAQAHRRPCRGGRCAARRPAATDTKAGTDAATRRARRNGAVGHRRDCLGPDMVDFLCRNDPQRSRGPRVPHIPRNAVVALPSGAGGARRRDRAHTEACVRPTPIGFKTLFWVMIVLIPLTLVLLASIAFTGSSTPSASQGKSGMDLLFVVASVVVPVDMVVV